MKDFVKWGAILAVVFIVWRVINGAGIFASGAVSSLQQSWTPGLYPPQTGGGVVYLSPGLTYGGRNPNWPGGGRVRNTYPSSGPGKRW
jgi:hypothetical protein